jgi:pyruvate dehydrogenase E1 component beta subunit
VVTEAPAEGGFSGEISATIHEHCFHDLQRPAQRLCSILSNIPYGPLERQVIPSDQKIVTAVQQLLGRVPEQPAVTG